LPSGSDDELEGLEAGASPHAQHISPPITARISLSPRFSLLSANLFLYASLRAPLGRRESLEYDPLDFDEAGVELTVQGAVTTLHFTAMLHPEVRFGVTIAATGNGLLVTYVEPSGAGHAQRVAVGDYLVRQDGAAVPRGIGDAAFVAQLVALGRPVELGFARQLSDDNDEVGPDDDDPRSPRTPSHRPPLLPPSPRADGSLTRSSSGRSSEGGSSGVATPAAIAARGPGPVAASADEDPEAEDNEEEEEEEEGDEHAEEGEYEEEEARTWESEGDGSDEGESSSGVEGFEEGAWEGSMSHSIGAVTRPSP
jgi:hypothetical protein